MDGLDSLNSYLETSSPSVSKKAAAIDSGPKSDASADDETMIKKCNSAAASVVQVYKDNVSTMKELGSGNVATVGSSSHGAENVPPQGSASSASNVLSLERPENCKGHRLASMAGATKVSEAAPTDGSAAATAAAAATAPAAIEAGNIALKESAPAPPVPTVPPVCSTTLVVAAPLPSSTPSDIPVMPSALAEDTGRNSDSRPTAFPTPSLQPPPQPGPALASAETSAHSLESSVLSSSGAPGAAAAPTKNCEGVSSAVSSSSLSSSINAAPGASQFDAFDAIFDDDAGLAQLDAVMAEHETKVEGGEIAPNAAIAASTSAVAPLAVSEVAGTDLSVQRAAGVQGGPAVADAVAAVSAGVAAAAPFNAGAAEQKQCLPGGNQRHITMNAPPPMASPPPPPPAAVTTAVVQPSSAFNTGDIDDDCDFDFEALDRLEREAIEKDQQQQQQQQQHQQQEQQKEHNEQKASQSTFQPSPPLPMLQNPPPLPIPIAPSLPSAISSSVASGATTAVAATVEAAAAPAAAAAAAAPVEVVVPAKEDKSAKRQSFGCGFDLDDADLAELDALMEQQQDDQKPAAPSSSPVARNSESVVNVVTDVSKGHEHMTMSTAGAAGKAAPLSSQVPVSAPNAPLCRASFTKSGDYVHHNGTEAFLADFDRRQIADHSEHLRSSSSSSSSVGHSSATLAPQSLAAQAPPALPPHAMQEAQTQLRQQSWVAGSSDCPSTVHRFVVLGPFVAAESREDAKSDVSKNHNDVSVAQKRPLPASSSWNECAVWAQPVAWPLRSNESSAAQQATRADSEAGATTAVADSGDVAAASDAKATSNIAPNSSDSSSSPPVVLCLRESWRDCPPAAGDVLHVIGGLFTTPHDPRRDPLPPTPPLLAAAPSPPSFKRTKGARKHRHPQDQSHPTSNNQHSLAAKEVTSTISAPTNGAENSNVFLGSDVGACNLEASGMLPSSSSSTGGGSAYASVWLVDDRHALVLNPDILLPPTRISTNTTCARRFVLQHRGATGLSLPSEAMVMGNLKHALLEAMLQAEPGTLRDGAVRRAMVAEVVAQTTVDRCSVDLSDMKSTAALMQSAPLLLDWVLKAFHHHNNAGAGSSGSNNKAWGPEHASGSALLSLQSVVACEEDIWAPEWGLKGKVDATVVARPHKSSLQRWVQPSTPQPSTTSTTATAASKSYTTGNPSDRVYPLELKTVMTKPNVYKQMEHRAQVMLYNLMIASRYGHAASGEGLLLYVEQGASGRSTSSQAVRSQMPELRSLLASRNRAAKSLAAQRASLSSPHASPVPAAPMPSRSPSMSSPLSAAAAAAAGSNNGNSSRKSDGHGSSSSSPVPSSASPRNRLELAFEQTPRITPLPPVLAAIAEADSAAAAAAAGTAAGSPLTRPRLLDDAASAPRSAEGTTKSTKDASTNGWLGNRESNGKENATEDDDGELPEGCKFCFEKPACSLYHATHESGNGRSSGMGAKAFGQLTNHLTPADAAYFRVWDRAVRTLRKRACVCMSISKVCYCFFGVLALFLALFLVLLSFISSTRRIISLITIVAFFIVFLYILL